MSADTPRPENPELLAAIIAHPDEDTPRLMYADWLQENGDPDRAEFIRLHIEWDRRSTYTPPDDDLKRRLIAAWEATEPNKNWLERARRWGRHYAFERGFLSTAEFDKCGDDFSDSAERIFGTSPVRVVYSDSYTDALNDDPKQLERFLKVAQRIRPITGFGTVLYSGCGYDAGCWAEYFKLEQASLLRVLDFNYSNGEDSCPLVAELTNLTNLLVLDLSVCCRLGDWCLEHLTSATHLQSLVALRLAANDEYLGSITADGIAALVKSPHLTKLRQLTLNNHEELNDVAVDRLLKWKCVEQLEVLEISCKDITDAGVAAIVRSRKVCNLHRLVLDGSRLHHATISAVLHSPNLRGLTELYLSPAPTSLPADLLEQLAARFPNYATMTFDPPAVCAEDRICSRYRLMIHPCGDGTYRGRGEAYGPATGPHEPPIHPEYAIL